MASIVSLLVSEHDHFRIEQVDATLPALQKIVDGDIEIVMSPDTRWHLYCDEEGKLKNKTPNIVSTHLVDQLYHEQGRPPFSAHDALVGTIAWLGPMDSTGGETSTSIELINEFSALALSMAVNPITIMRHGDDIWAYDSPHTAKRGITSRVETARRASRNGGEHGSIEVWPNISTPKWVELRVEMMDSITITLHDRRANRSFG